MSTKRSSLLLVLIAILGLTAYFLLRNSPNPGELEHTDKTPERSAVTDSAAASPDAEIAQASLTKQDTHASECTSCSVCQPKSAKAVPQLITNPEADYVFKYLAKSDRKLIARDTFDFLRGSQPGQEVSFEIGELSFEGAVGISREEHPVSKSYTIRLDDDFGLVRVTTDAGGALTGHIFFYGDSRVLQAKSALIEGEGEQLIIEETKVASVLCAAPDTVLTKNGMRSVSGMPWLKPPSDPADESTSSTDGSAPNNDEGTSGAPTGALSEIPSLQSVEGAEFVIYLDFDGHVLTGSLWNEIAGVGSIVAPPFAQANDDEWINLIWQRVAEDYAPFNINVTTDEAVFLAADPTKACHIVFTPNDEPAPGAGGVALVHAFRSIENVCWVFIDTEYAGGIAASHEAGHTLGLEHHALVGFPVDYYAGHNDSYTPGWAPIMGASYLDGVYDEVVQWSIGEYAGATNSGQDDVAIIGDTVDPQDQSPNRPQRPLYNELSNGFGFVTDDYGDSFDVAGVGNFNVIAENVVQASGVISTREDKDVFRFTAPEGALRFVVTPLDVDSVYPEPGSETSGANLAADTQLLDETGAVIATGIDAGSNFLTSVIETAVVAGDYFLVVDGGGRGTDPSTGFSDYGSLGQYDVSGELDLPPLSVLGGLKQNVAVFNGTPTTDPANGTDFGFTALGVPVTSTFALKNFGLVLPIDNIVISIAGGPSSPFSVGSQITDPLPADRERFMDIIYNPSSTGVDNDTVIITYDYDGEVEQYEFAIRGFAVQSLNKDNYEENDNFNNGAPYDLSAVEGIPLSAYRGPAFFLDDKHDWYSFTVEESDDYIQVDVAYDQTAGNVEFKLINFNNTELDATEAGLGRLQFIIPENYTGAQREFFIYVTTTDDATVRNEYDLVWNAIEFIADGDDFYEENDSQIEAYDLTNRARQLSQLLGNGVSEDEDWYRIDVPADPFIRMLYAKATFDNSLGNIDIEVYQGGVLVGTSASEAENEEVVTFRETVLLENYTPAFFPGGNTSVTGLAPGTYYVRVFGDFAGNSYDLIFDTLSDDRYEVVAESDDPGLPDLENDAQADAFDLGGEIVGKFLSEIDGAGVSAAYLADTVDPFVNTTDDDWYKFTMPADIDAEQVTLEYITDVSGRMTYAIYNAAGTELVRTEDGSTDPGTLLLANPVETEYYILVRPQADIDYLSGYDFRIEVSEEPPFVDNPEEDNYEENDNIDQAYDITSNEGRYLSSIAGYGTHLDRDYFKFTVPSNAAKLRTSLFFDDSVGDLDLYLDKAPNSGPGARNLISSNGTEVETITLEGDQLYPGPYILRVLSPDGVFRGNVYNLIWDVTLSEDNYEENDSLAQAFDLTGFEDRFISKLDDVGIQADDDWFEIAAYADTARLTASISFTHADGDIDLALYDADGALIQRSISVTNSETVVFNNPPAGTYYLRAYFDNEANEYDLIWAAQTQAELDLIPEGDDNYEENDTQITPFVLGDTQRRLSTVDGLGIQKDDDWYQFEVAEGNVGFRLEVSFIDSLGDIDFEVYDPRGFPLGVRDGVTDNELFVIENPVPVGTYLVRVYGTNLGNEYDLFWNVFFDDIYEENDVVGQAYDITPLLGTPLSDTGVPTLSDEDWYVFDAIADLPFIRVELEHANIDGEVDFELYQKVLDGPPVLLATADSSDDFESILLPVDSGTYYVRVTGDYLYQIYDLTVSVIGDDIYEQNDSSAEPADITGSPQIQAVQFDDDWYSFDVAVANAFLSVVANFSHDNGNIDIAIYDSSDLVNPLATSTTTDDNENLRVPGVPGTYFVRVFGDNTNEFYELFWIVAADDEFEQNDVIEDATDVRSREGLEINALQYDEDWFEVFSEPGDLRLIVDLLFLNDEGNLSLSLYNAAGDELLVVDSDTDNEQLIYNLFPFGTADETFYIKVDGDDIGTEYTLLWQTSKEDDFEGDTGNNTYFTASEDLLVSEGKRISDTIGYGGALNDDWYEVRINPGDVGVVIELYHEHSDELGNENNIDLELFSAGQIFLRRSVGFSDVERIHYKGSPGTYYLRVFGTSANKPYDLIWNSYAEDNLEPGFSVFIGQNPPDNDSPASPRGLQYILPNLVRGSTDLEFVILDNLTLLDEDWYLFEVLEGEDICLVDLEFDNSMGDIDVALYYAGSADFFAVPPTEPPFENSVLVGVSDTQEDNENIAITDMPAGWYLICVYGYGIVNPKDDPAWISSSYDPFLDEWDAGSFDPFTDDYTTLEENPDPSFAYYELDEPNAQMLGNTYSLRWISTTDDIYDVITEDDEFDVEINDTRGTAAVPPLRDQYDILDDDGIIDAQPRERTEIGPGGVPVTFEYQPLYTYPDLSQLDEDWFQFSIDTGGEHGFRAAIVYSIFQADLDLRIYNSAGVLLQASEGQSSIEFVEITGQGLQTYYVQVVGEDLGTPYTLEVRGFRPEDAFDDLYEENDTRETCADISDRNGIPVTDLVKRDEDWFCIEVPDDQVHLVASAISLTELMDVEIYDANGVQLPQGYDQTTVISPEGGTYYLRVIGGTSGSNYVLYFEYDNFDEYEGFFTNDSPELITSSVLTRFRLQPVYDPENNRYAPPIQEIGFDYGLLSNLVFVNGVLIDPFGHGIQEADDWFAIQIPSWYLDTAQKGNDNIQVLKRNYNVRFNLELEFTHVDGNIDMEVYGWDPVDGDIFDLGDPLARATSSDDIETINMAVDPTNEDIFYLVRVFGDDAENDYSLKWDVTTDDAYEQLEDELEANDTNNFVDKAFNLTNADGVSTEATWLHEIQYLKDVNADGEIDALDGGFTQPRGYGNQTTDDWYAVVVSEGATQIEVDVRFYSDNDTGYTYARDNLDVDFEVYFLAGNDGDPLTTDLRKPVLVGRSTGDTDDSVFVADGFEAKALPEDVTREVAESATFDVDEPGIYFIRIYYDNRTHPYTFYWDDIGDTDNSGDEAIYNEYVNGNWSFEIIEELPSAPLPDPLGNLDGDRFPNYAEYALGLNPDVADYAVIGQTIGEINGQIYYQFEYVRNKEAVALGYEFIVQESDDMSFDGQVAEFVAKGPVPGSSVMERVIYRCSKPMDQQDKCFFRLVVNQPPAPKD